MKTIQVNESWLQYCSHQTKTRCRNIRQVLFKCKKVLVILLFFTLIYDLQDWSSTEEQIGGFDTNRNDLILRLCGDPDSLTTGKFLNVLTGYHDIIITPKNLKNMKVTSLSFGNILACYDRGRRQEKIEGILG